MTPQERSLLENFLSQLTQVRGVAKDAEAERLIAQAVEQQPDATYLVVQRALLLVQALEQAKARIAALEQGEGRGQGFLDPNASGWGNAAAASRGQVAPSGYGPQGSGAPVYGAPGYGPQGYGAPYPGYGGPAPGGGFSSFLGQAAATAAGVAGGEFLFQGIENLFGGHHGGGFGGGGYGSGEDVTINNYYGPDEVVVDNNINQPLPDDSDATFSNDDVLGDDQDFV